MLRFVHISDTHIGVSPDYDSYGQYSLANAEAIVTHLNELPFEVDFVLHTGDVVYNPDPTAYPYAYKVLQRLKYPVFYVRGNHDIPQAMRAYLPNVPDGHPDHLDYDFWVKDFHFVVLDSHGYTKTIGILQEDQLQWLYETLTHSQAESIVISLHHLPLVTGIACYDERMILKNHDDLFEVLRPHRERIRGIFYGHIHRDTLAQREGIICSSAPATWFQLMSFPDGDLAFRGDADAPPGFKVVTLTHQQTWVTSHTIPKPPRP